MYSQGCFDISFLVRDILPNKKIANVYLKVCNLLDRWSSEARRKGWGMTQKSSKQLAQDVVPLLNMFSNQINFTVLSDALPNFFQPFCSMCFINLQDSFGSSKHICCHCNSLKTFCLLHCHKFKSVAIVIQWSAICWSSLIVMLGKFSIRALANETSNKLAYSKLQQKKVW